MTVPQRWRPQPGGRARRDVGVRRYLGLKQFALLAGVPYRRLQQCRLDGPLFVPEPVVMVGRRPGWALPTIQAWSPDYLAGSGPVPIQMRWPEPTRVCLDSAALCRIYRVRAAGLWPLIARGDIAQPDVWVDDTPGWSPDLGIEEKESV
ncbi:MULTISPECIES: hypothetical protein [unclassified Nocardia]|uniref:hypothetical protein n=1 Tax=unclassified Nocardia TaxID=2637762 RepID=UPI00278BD8F0|nr:MULTISPECIES: hypothetical protein [unclassified Nocardia]